MLRESLSVDKLINASLVLQPNSYAEKGLRDHGHRWKTKGCLTRWRRRRYSGISLWGSVECTPPHGTDTCDPSMVHADINILREKDELAVVSWEVRECGKRWERVWSAWKKALEPWRLEFWINYLTVLVIAHYCIQFTWDNHRFLFNPF